MTERYGEPDNSLWFRYRLDELFETHAFELGIYQDYDDLSRPITLVMAGAIPQPKEIFGDGEARTIEVYRRKFDDIENTLLNFKVHYPPGVFVASFLLTPKRAIVCSDNGRPIDSEEFEVINYLLQETVWDSHRSAELATGEQIALNLVARSDN